MFYFGTGLRAIGGFRGTEPALIDPALVVDLANPDWSGTGLHYWPSYEGLKPAERAAYLLWLASSRDNPDTPTGFVFLYFYGLERRALMDASTLADPRAELNLVADEVKRLKSIYGSGSSFRSYASSFLATLEFLSGPNEVPDGPPPIVEAYSWEFPPALKFGLGRLAATGHPIPGDWAFEWTRAMSQTRFRHVKCPEEFANLFAIRYQEKFGSGVLLKPTNNRASASYRPASASFGGEFQFTQDVPDVTVVSDVVAELDSLAEQCAKDLLPYSRYVARHPEGRNNLAAAAYLPKELVHDGSRSAVGQFTAWVESSLADKDQVLIGGHDLVRQWPSATPGKLVKAEAAAMAELLGSLGFGVEPDVRFSGPVVGEGKVVLFRLGESTTGPGPAWEPAAAILQLTANLISSEAQNAYLLDRVANQLQEGLQLRASERNRIRAHLWWATTLKLSVASTKRALAELDPTTKKQIGNFLIDVAATSGEVGLRQVTALTTAFKVLDLQPTTIYSLLHERSTGPATEPIEVRPGRPAPAGEAVPHEPKKLTADLLNQDLIREKFAESARATALLGEIFSDTEEIDSYAEPSSPDGAAPFSGALYELVKQLSRQASWSVEEFSALAKKHGQLPNAAIETINERTLELFDEPLLEGGAAIGVNQDVLKELLA
jgi:hypothetical protein